MDDDDANARTGDEGTVENGGANNEGTSNTVEEEKTAEESEGTEGGAGRPTEVEEEERQVSSFQEEDSVSRDSAALRGDALADDGSRDQNTAHDAGGTDKVDFVDEGQSMDAMSIRSEENSRSGNQENEAEAVVLEEESRESTCSASKEKDKEQVTDEAANSNESKTSKDKEVAEPNESIDLAEVIADEGEDANSRMEVLENQDDLGESLMANEIMMDDDESEDLVAEVDISAMMEVNFDDGSQSSNQQGRGDDEHEVIPLDSDDDGESSAQVGEDSHPVVAHTDEAVYQIDDQENVLEVDPAAMIQVEVGEGNDSGSGSSALGRRPRRAAAEAAAKTIHQLSSLEVDLPQSSNSRSRRRSNEDKEFDVNEEINSYSNEGTLAQQSHTSKQRCHVCLKITNSGIVIRQFGADISLCSNTCFNKFRNQGSGSRNKVLPCGKCGSMHNDQANEAYYWETMNFCTDFCVGRYQMDVGCKCCTCGSNVSWNSLGKYCVRFGSDIRQFCTPQCLDGYKKNARVCFHCQLDIRRSGNVILANIPAKTTPKEFCSNDCVELYCDRNMHQPSRAKPIPEHHCAVCRIRKPIYRELALANGNSKTCSASCWTNLLLSKSITKADKCEMCAKYVNMDLGFTKPVYWLSTNNRIYGFCSHVCKNLYILNTRKILACTSCKVKKYNYDLIEFYSNNTQRYAVCSLACLPKPNDYLKKIRDILFIPQPILDRAPASSVPKISSVSSVRFDENGKQLNNNRRKQQHVVDSTEVIEIVDDDDDDYSDDDIQIPDSDNILDILTVEELEEVIKHLTHRPETRDMKCMAKPRTRTIETQTDVSELDAMERIPRVDDYFVPVPIPAVMNVPFPGYFLDSPYPVPFPVPIPIPILIPVIIPTKPNPVPTEVNERKDDQDPDKDESDKTEKKDDPSPSTSSNHQAASNSSNYMDTSTSSTSNTPSAPNERSTPVAHEYKIIPDLDVNPVDNRAHRGSRSNSTSIPLTPTPSVPSPPDYVRRIVGPGSGHNFPSPSYPQENSYPTSIFPSPISSYSPTYASSPIPPLNPVAPIPGPPQVNRSTPPNRDYCCPPSMGSQIPGPPVNRSTPPFRDYCCPPSLGTQHPGPPLMNRSTPPHRDHGCPPSSLGPQIPGCCGYDTPPRQYMPPAVPMIRPPVVPPVGSGYGTHSSSSSMGYSNPPPPTMPITTFVPQPPAPKSLRVENALRAWKMMFGPTSDPRSLSSIELSSKLCDLINRGCKPSGERYRAELLLYISLGIQQLLRDNNRVDKLFYDNMYYNFVLAFTDRAERELTVGIHSKIDEQHFWDTSELGANSPGVLLFTLIFMFYKHFGLKTWETHAALQFSNIIIQSRYDSYGRYVRYMTISGVPGIQHIEITEDTSAPDRCILKVFEFYCFKSQIQNGPFYKCLRQDYTPRTPWFTSQPLDQRHIYQMLVRASMISNSSDNFS